jgi:hypothetical protein
MYRVSQECTSKFGRLAIRWTIGNVHPRGFELLRLSILCAFRLFGPAARYLVCVNSIPVEEARLRTGSVPAAVEWRRVSYKDLHSVFSPFFDESVIEGMGWKLVPLRAFRDCYELALDNDCILWDLPRGLEQWLLAERSGLLSEDVARCLGSFDALCRPGSYNAGIRGLPPAVDLQTELRIVMEEANKLAGGSLRLRDEIEEQGLQAAAMCRVEPLYLVRTSEVSICSPFWPRSPELGSCGAHFVGMNAHHIDWNYYDRPADEWLKAHWDRHRQTLYEKAGL